MIDIAKHEKAAAAFNSVLIGAALVLGVIALFNVVNIWFGIALAALMLALVSGFVYTIGGYKKASAVYYKIFMILFAVSIFFDLIGDLITTISMRLGSYTSDVILLIILIGAVILAFGKDLGKKTSVYITYAMLAVQIINSVRLIVLHHLTFSSTVKPIMSVVVVCIACMFVAFKYADKTARGTK